MPQEFDGLPRDPQTVVALGKRKLRETLSPELESQHHGQVVVIDIDSGELAFGKTMAECRRKLGTSSHARCYGERVGRGPVYSFRSIRQAGTK